jgi:GT2 family glycosyltransferase
LNVETSIITINYNGVNDTCGLIETLPLDDTSIEVIVVDNASENDEATLIEQRYPQVKVIRSTQNLGFAGGNNLGIQAAQGKYLFFLNNDSLGLECILLFFSRSDKFKSHQKNGKGYTQSYFEKNWPLPFQIGFYAFL